MCILSAPRLPLSPNPEKNPLAACIEKTHSRRLRPTLGTLVGMLGGDTHLSASQVLIFTETSRSKKPPKKAKPPAAVALKMLQKTMQWKSSEEKTFFESFLFDDTRVHNHTSLSPLHHTLSLSLHHTLCSSLSRVCNPVTHTRACAQYPVTAHTQSCRARAISCHCSHTILSCTRARTHTPTLTHTHTRCSAALSTRHEKAPAQHPPAPACCSSATHTHTP